MSSLDAGLEATQGRTGPADDRPLSQQEYQLLQRLLSDPFSLPIQFKTWLVSYMETSDMNLPLSSIQGLRSILGISGVGGGTLGTLPAGLVFPYGGTSAPTGSKLCNGAGYSTTTEKRLFDAIGYGFGGSGATFNVPDIQERVPVGRGSRAGYTAVGQSEGRGVGTRGLEHHHGTHGHGVNENPHRHPQNGYGGGTTTGGPGPQGAADTTPEGFSDYASTGMTVSPAQVGSTSDTPDRPAFLVLNFIIVS